jgi:hypothetical protein
VRVNDLKVFQRNPLKPFWPPLTIQREFDAYVLCHGLIRYDRPDPTSKPGLPSGHQVHSGEQQ